MLWRNSVNVCCSHTQTRHFGDSMVLLVASEVGSGRATDGGWSKINFLIMTSMVCIRVFTYMDNRLLIYETAKPRQVRHRTIPFEVPGAS